MAGYDSESDRVPKYVNGKSFTEAPKLMILMDSILTKKYSISI